MVLVAGVNTGTAKVKRLHPQRSRVTGLVVGYTEAILQDISILILCVCVCVQLLRGFVDDVTIFLATLQTCYTLHQPLNQVLEYTSSLLITLVSKGLNKQC